MHKMRILRPRTMLLKICFSDFREGGCCWAAFGRPAASRCQFAGFKLTRKQNPFEFSDRLWDSTETGQVSDGNLGSQAERFWLGEKRRGGLAPLPGGGKPCIPDAAPLINSACPLFPRFWRLVLGAFLRASVTQYLKCRRFPILAPFSPFPHVRNIFPPPVSAEGSVVGRRPRFSPSAFPQFSI